MNQIKYDVFNDVIITQGVLPSDRKIMSKDECKRESKNFMLGRLEIDPGKKEDLKYVRDLLMSHESNLGNYEVINKRAVGLSSMVNGGYSRDMLRDALVYKRIMSSSREDDICDYEYKEYRSIYLNSILLFTSLLNDFDVSKYDKLVKKFNEVGIYGVKPIEEIWRDCSRRMTDLSDDFNIRTQLRDWKIFRTAIKTGCLHYEVLEKITPEERGRYSEIYGSFQNNKRALDELAINNSLILGDNYYLRKQKKNR